MKILIIAGGFHAAKNAERLQQNLGYSNAITEFIIPKGAKYFEDKTGLIVSNKIIFKCIIEDVQNKIQNSTLS